MSTDSEIKLHLGCGHNKIPGWINIDSVEEFHPDLLHDLSRPLPFPDGTIAELLAKDILEHFDKFQRFFVFYDWVRVLRLGGTVTVGVPNLPKIFYKYFKFPFEKWVEFVFGETLFGETVYIGHFGTHKWGYSVKTLTEFVKVFGITPISTECRGQNIVLTGRKDRVMSQQEFDDIKVPMYSAPKPRSEMPYVSLGFAREKIVDFQEKDPGAMKNPIPGRPDKHLFR